MSLLSRRFGARESRAITEWGTSAIPGPLGGGAGMGGSFASVDLRRAESSLQKVAVWSSVDLIAGLASQLPLHEYREGPDGTSVRINSDVAILDDPEGRGYGVGDWVYQYLTSKLLRGNVYGRELGMSSDTGRPDQIVLYHPDDVIGSQDRYTGAIRWRVEGRDLPAGVPMWHRRSYPLPGQLLGQSPIARHVGSITQGIASTRFGVQFFTDGAHPSSMLTNDQVEIDQPKALEVKARYMSTVYGTREPLVLGRGWVHKPLSVLPNESQFLETQKFTGAECCRIFGPCLAEMLGYETGGSMTYQTIEQRSIDLLKFVLNRWLVDVEQTLSKYLPRKRYAQFNRAAILQTDLLSRYRAHNMAVAGHWMAPSEVRKIEDLPKFTQEQIDEIDKMQLPPPEMNPLKESEK